jgi:NADH:ubiquinone oxidoreductase subunit F (NADH-binding)/(2Fe-2S) ferredoxin
MKFAKHRIFVAEDSKSLSKGAKEIERFFKKEIENNNISDIVSVYPTGSLGYEDLGIAVAIYPDNVLYAQVSSEKDVKLIVKTHFIENSIVESLKKPFKHFSQIEKIMGIQQRIVLENVGRINPEDIKDYIAFDGYVGFENVLKMSPEKVIEEIELSELRGRGGAGFPTGKKWRFTAQAKSNEKYIVCNADEGEPGTFKDRTIMEGDPHRIIEGMLIAGYATGANNGIIYIRGEYALSIDRLQKAIDQAYELGLLGKNILSSGFNFDVEIKRGAGAYVCGEETALLNSIEGKRGEPRKKPPYPPTAGLWGKPTVINNVETLANIPSIMRNGAKWFKQFGVPSSYGTKLFSLSGDVNWKGVIEVPFGMPLSYIINEIGGGVKNGTSLKAVILGGVSGTLITSDEVNTPVDFNSLAKIEAGPGSGSITVLNDMRCIVDVVKNIAYFFRHESCGKCTPCRVGTDEMYKIIDRVSHGKGKESDISLMKKLGRTMKLTSFCGLGQTAPNIILQSLEKFPGEWKAHITEKRCPVNVCEMED